MAKKGKKTGVWDASRKARWFAARYPDKVAKNNDIDCGKATVEVPEAIESK